ncbi:MAG: polysaccharide pyruvyl transferase family protein [Pseudomonadales bacterium]
MKTAILINDTTYDFHHGCEAVVKGIKSSFLKRGVKIVHACPVGVNFRDDEKLLALANNVDLIIVNGEGTIHHGREKAKWLLDIAQYSKSNEVPCVLINATYQENPESFDSMLKNFDLIFVRESSSLEVMKSIGIDSGFAPDLTMLLSEDFTQKKPSIRQGIGITDSPVIHESINNIKSSYKYGWDFLPVLRSNRLEGELSFKETLRHLKFIITKKKKSKSVDSISESEYLEIRNSYINPTIKGYLEKLDNKELILASRFHSLCFTLVTETPFIAISGNSHKVEGILYDLGLTSRLVKSEIFNENINASDYSFTPHELNSIREYKKDAVKKINDMFDSCVALIK